MKFGVILPNYRHLAGVEAIKESALKAEVLGFDSVWTTDHLVVPNQYVDRFGASIFEPLTALMYIAGATRRVRLGTSVIILGYRNPILVAKMVSTLDCLSGGRVIFGAAAGWMKEEFDILKVPFEERGDISDEYLKIMKTLWVSEAPAFQGRYFQFSGIKFLPQPVQKPHPPVWIGGNSKRAIRRAVELGDGWHPNYPNAEALKEGLQYLKQLSARRGRPNPPEITYRTPAMVTDGPAEARPMFGGASKVIDDVHTYEGLGVSYLVLDFPGATLAEFLRNMESFAQKVIPAFS